MLAGRDLKELHQLEAEKISLEDYDMDFYDLERVTKFSVYNKATERVEERLMAEAVRPKKGERWT